MLAVGACAMECIAAVSPALLQHPPTDLFPDLQSAHEVFPPMVVARTDEFYKPALLKDGRLIAVALPKVNGLQEGGNLLVRQWPDLE